MMSRGGVQHRVTVVGPDVDVEGELVSHGLVEIHGRVKGSVRVDGRVVVCREASCVSDIAADSVEIAGLVRGDVRADTLLLTSTGRLQGAAFCRRRLIRKGGVIEPAPASPAQAVAAARDEPEVAAGGDAGDDVHIPYEPVPEMNAVRGEVAPATDPAATAPAQAPATAPTRPGRGQFVVSW